MSTMQQHFVTFLSPGSFTSETTTKPIESWDVEQAAQMARDVTARYNATPYGFYFTTRSRKEDDLDSSESARSGTYFLGGEVRTAEEVLSGTDPDEKVLRSNIKSNDIKRIVVNRNSFKTTMPLEDGDTVLDWTK